ncbi:UDP-glucose 4-epimerase GalE [Streptococcus canis]|uniref:UDP-glucose 4-epimerase GalE n=1 Tax=Streptococcus canis TaxID=1329 RepID=UPI002996F0F7|nr:UDP-glucose 4-epimerase GalE [Streptococcus canis]
MMSTILVTGGAGYIGSHTCVELLEKGHDLVVVDNLENANPKSLKVVEELTGKPITFYQTDILDEAGLEAIFSKHEISAVIHFAGLKAVGESTQMPLKYFTTNISGTLTLLRVMAKHQCKNIIFSSSATVYGDPHKVPIIEDFPLSVTNPYGRTKLMVEEILKDVYQSDKSWNIVILRYFNPIGAHQSGELGEDPTGIPNNLVPYVTQVAVGRLERIGVFGDDYDTPDGTGVRDYIHVVDLAKGHVAALQKLVPNSGLSIYNLGTGNGYSVLDIVKTMSEVVGKAIPYQIQPRRAGDIAVCYADSNKAKEDLGWQAKYDIRRMCQDHWCWQSKHPNGFQD